jgi:2-oxo-3-hexenedioate decarboxylase
VDLDALADELSLARVAGTVIEAPSSRTSDFSIADGYSVGRLLHDRRIASGDVPAGLKLGFTNKTIWAGLGLDSPFWSPIYQDTLLDAGVVSVDGFVAPRIEPEIVLGFGADLDAGASRDEIAAAVEWAALGFEVVHCHFAAWRMAPADAIADGGLHGALVVGDRVRVNASDADRLDEMTVSLFRQDEMVERGTGAAALGGPTDAIAWLLRLPGVEALASGAIVTTGTLTTAMAIAHGETWRVEADGPITLGQLEVTFAS